MKKNLRILSTFLLLLTSLIWGFAFVAQSVAMDSVRPLAFIFMRFLVGGIVLLPISIISSKIYKDEDGYNNFSRNERDGRMPDMRKNSTSDRIPDVWGNSMLGRVPDMERNSILGGMCCGIFLGLASWVQQVGILTTTVGKAGFITALYVVLVPLVAFFFGRKPPLKVYVSTIIGLFGLYLISMKAENGFHIETGDAMVLLSAFLFTFQIISIDHFSKGANPVLLSNAQFFTASAVGFLGMLLFEELPGIKNIQGALIPILYAGVLSSGVAYTLQVIAQKFTDPSIASLVMSLESVFSAIAGWLILGQVLSPREILGCSLVFLAVILAELP